MTPPSEAPTPRRRDAEATRATLVHAGLELFTTLGYHGTTTALVAARAGLAEGTIYRHFPGKEHLFAEAHRTAQRWGATLVKGTADPDRPLPAAERLRRVGRKLLEGAEKEPALLRMAIGGRGEEAPAPARGRDDGEEFREALEQVIASGKSDGVIRAGPAELWAGVWLTIVGSAAERVASREWGVDHPSAGLVLDAAWDAIAVGDK